MTSPTTVAADVSLGVHGSQSTGSPRPGSPASARSSSVFCIDLRATVVNDDPLPPCPPAALSPGSPRSGAQASDTTSSAFSSDYSDPAVHDSSPPPTQLMPLRQPLRRAGRAPSAPAIKRQSAHIAAKAANADGTFQDMTATAVKHNSLSGCSAGLKKHVTKKNLLSRSKLPMCASEIRKLVDAVGLGCSSKAGLDIVNAVAE